MLSVIVENTKAILHLLPITQIIGKKFKDFISGMVSTITGDLIFFLSLNRGWEHNYRKCIPTAPPKHDDSAEHQ